MSILKFHILFFMMWGNWCPTLSATEAFRRGCERSITWLSCTELLPTFCAVSFVVIVVFPSGAGRALGVTLNQWKRQATPWTGTSLQTEMEPAESCCTRMNHCEVATNVRSCYMAMKPLISLQWLYTLEARRFPKPLRWFGTLSSVILPEPWFLRWD